MCFALEQQDTAATLTVTSDKQTHKHTYTISESPAGPQNCHDMHTQHTPRIHTHTHASPKAAAKVAVLNQTDKLVHTQTHLHTHRMTALIHAADTTSTYPTLQREGREAESKNIRIMRTTVLPEYSFDSRRKTFHLFSISA